MPVIELYRLMSPALDLTAPVVEVCAWAVSRIVLVALCLYCECQM